jgi:hypothetical protein
MKQGMLCALALLAAVSARSARAGIEPGNLTAFYPPAGRSTLIPLVVSPDLAQESVPYSIEDYWGARVAGGEIPAGTQRHVSIPVALPQGYYEVVIGEPAARFGIAALHETPIEADPFFCIDAGLSWLQEDPARRRQMVETFKHAGIPMARERMNWGAVEPSPGRWEWEADKGYETVRRLYADVGVEILEVWHLGPSWAGKVGLFPADLIATSRSWHAIAQHWGDLWSALELWNEPDLEMFSGGLPADQYAALAQSSVYGVRASGKPVTVVGGVIGVYSRAYLETLGQCGVLNYCDAFSFHDYEQAPHMEASVGRYRAWLADYGRPATPMWITECGRPSKSGTDRPVAQEDRLSALDIVMKGVEARACGVARYFPFVYPFFEFAGGNYGMTDQAGAPLRSMAAYAFAAQFLAQSTYAGDLSGVSGVQRARVFIQPGGQAWAVLYTGTPQSDARASLPVEYTAAHGIDGRALGVEEGHVSIPDGLTYIQLDNAEAAAHLNVDTEAMRLTRLARSKPQPAAAPAPVVVRPRIDSAVETPSPAGHVLKRTRQADPPLTVDVFNLGAAPLTVQVTLELDAPGAKIMGQPVQQIELEPESKATLTWNSNLAEAFEQTDVVTARWTAASGALAQPVTATARYIGHRDLAHTLVSFRKNRALPINELSRWTQSIAPGGTMEMRRLAPQGWELEARFEEENAWVYPYFTLPEDVAFAPDDELVLRGRCNGEATVRVMFWEGDTQVGYMTRDSVLPSDGEWYAVRIRLSTLVHNIANAPDPNGRFDPETVRRISIGMNMDAGQAVLTVSDLYVASP